LKIFVWLFKENKGKLLADLSESTTETAMVMSCCHSLVEVQGSGLVGDPIEVAALNGLSWHYNSKDQISKPGNLQPVVRCRLAALFIYLFFGGGDMDWLSFWGLLLLLCCFQDTHNILLSIINCGYVDRRK
jgi:hypothetical protein